MSKMPPLIVAESACKCPTTSAPESDTVNLLVPPCVICKLPAPFAKTLGDSNIAVLPPLQLIPSPLPGSLNCNALTPSILLLLSLKTVATAPVVNRRELEVPLIVKLVKVAESAVS